MTLRNLNLKLAAGVALAVIALIAVVGASAPPHLMTRIIGECIADPCTTGPSLLGVILGILQLVAWLALIAVGILALWRRFGPQTDDTDGVDGPDPFDSYGRAGYDAYQHLMADGGAPAPYTDTPGYLVLGAQAQPQEPAPAPAPAPADPDAVDFDALFQRGKGGE